MAVHRSTEDLLTPDSYGRILADVQPSLNAFCQPVTISRDIHRVYEAGDCIALCSVNSRWTEAS